MNLSWCTALSTPGRPRLTAPTEPDVTRQGYPGPGPDLPMWSSELQAGERDSDPGPRLPAPPSVTPARRRLSAPRRFAGRPRMDRFKTRLKRFTASLKASEKDSIFPFWSRTKGFGFKISNACVTIKASCLVRAATKIQNQEICHALTGQCAHFFGSLRLVLTCDCLRSRWSGICCAVAAKLLILLEEPAEMLFEFK